MFTFAKWKQFCAFVKESGTQTLRADQFLGSNIKSPFIILKHDVETNPQNALEIARIEHSFGLCGTYYVQGYLLDESVNIPIFKEIQTLGHEVSYHYDVMDSNQGDIERAKIEFDKYIKLFQSQGFKIQTVCQHGNPVIKRSGYTSNRDFFRRSGNSPKYDAILDIVVNFKSELNLDYTYISDAGLQWNIIGDPETDDQNATPDQTKIAGIVSLQEMIANGDSLVISMHPHRWQRSYLKLLLKTILFKVLKKIAWIVLKIPGTIHIFSRFYHLAKKI
jgi:hypothetical protein